MSFRILNYLIHNINYTIEHNYTNDKKGKKTLNTKMHVNTTDPKNLVTWNSINLHNFFIEARYCHNIFISLIILIIFYHHLYPGNYGGSYSYLMTKV